MTASLPSMSNLHLDEVFRSGSAGPVPAGDTQGTLLAFPGTPLVKPLARLTRALLWQGKVFDPERRTLKNKLLPLGFRAVEARVGPQASWVDQKECILIDYSHTRVLPIRLVRDEIRLVGPGEYLGVIWIGRRRVGWFSLTV